MNNKQGRILVVEDHRESARVLQRVCERCFPGSQTVVVHSYLAAVETIQAASNQSMPGENSEHFFLALIDIGLPDGIGINLIAVLEQYHPQAIAIITTIFDDDEHLLNALRAGASGYLLKGHSEEELIRYLQEALSGQPALSPSIARSVLAAARHAKVQATQVNNPSAAEANEQLTAREVEILQIIARGYSTKEAGKLLNISSNTICVHVKSIYKKLGINNRAEAVTAAQRLSLY
jgi:DNA-binding NarL/FixJ family response regulator